MSYTGAPFLLVFLPILLVVYWLFYRRPVVQNAVLLAGSFVFYASFSKRYVLVLLAGILISWFGGTQVAKNRRVLIPFVIANLFPLLFFKYGKTMLGMWYLLMPVGLSFYSLQSTSYLFDIANGKTQPETSLVDYALYVSFFPTIVSGPIQKSYQFLPDIKARKSITYNDAVSGCLIFLYGAFLKMVIADRIALFTSPIFEYYSGYEGAVVLTAAILYSIEIYCDFFGYTCMVSGIARLFGYRLRDNFRQPYFAVSISDFWKRWHMSLTSWLTEYVYYPLGGNRKGTLRKYINILIIFIVSALWHGTGLQFAVWGLLHGFYRIIEELTASFRTELWKKLGVDTSKYGWTLLRRIWIFALVTIAWVFFRAKDVPAAAGFLAQVFHDFNVHVFFDGTLFQLTLDEIHFRVVILAIIAMRVVSHFREQGRRAEDVLGEALPVRWALILILLFAVLIAGVYGPSYDAANFIYANF